MRTKISLLVGALALVIGPDAGLTQYPVGGNGQGRGGGGKSQDNGNFDPGQWFDQLSRGKPVWNRSKITDPSMQQMFDDLASKLGVTNGQITREQFLQAAPQMMAQWRGGRGQGGSPSAGGIGSTASPAPAPGAPRRWGNPDRDNARAEDRFRSLDRNADGILDADEMPRTLRTELEKWDTNKDGFIDLSEFRAYFRARHEQSRADQAALSPDAPPLGSGPTGAAATPEKRAEDKPVVYRAGKLPKELPAWFEQLDTDHDGQVGLYEWKASGWPIRQFLAMDRNNDGFLTVNEVLKALANLNQAGGPPGRTGGGVSGAESRTTRLAMGNDGGEGAPPGIIRAGNGGDRANGGNSGTSSGRGNQR